MPTNTHFIIRLKATIVDFFMIYMPILYIITYVALGDKEQFLSNDLMQFVGVLFYAIISAVLTSKYAQTPGKKAYDIQIINKDGSKLSLLKAFVRFWLFLFSAMILVGVLLPLSRKDNLALHDLILNTKVVYKNK